jgi:hypothetical protein
MVKELYNENYKRPRKEIEEHIKKENDRVDEFN